MESKIMDTSIFINPEEQRRHQNMIDSLARQLDTTEDTISVLYEGELRKLSVSARIREFLPILTARLVRDSLMISIPQDSGSHEGHSTINSPRQTTA